MSFFRKLLGMQAKPEIKELTDFLVNNQTFVRAAKTIHSTKSGFFGNIDKFLEKELLPKEFHTAGKEQQQ